MGERKDKGGLDTSFPLRLLVAEPADQATLAVHFLEERIQERTQLLVSDMVVAETYFALHHHYGVPKREALNALREVLESGQITCVGCAPEVLGLPRLESAKPGFVDRLIHCAYIKHSGDLVSFEKAARKLPRTIVL